MTRSTTYLIVWGQKLDWRDTQHTRNLLDNFECGITPPTLEFPDVAVGQARLKGQRFKRHAASVPRSAYVPSEIGS